MILDKGLGPAETRDLLEVAGNYIDFIKLGFGTAALYDPVLLAAKVQLIRSFGIHIYPGGTFLEIAIARGRLPACLQQLREIGFTAVEISDGSLTLDPKIRMRAINLARDAGFMVLAEVGKKNPHVCPGPLEMARQAIADLNAGADWIIVEGRENGSRTWIYDAQGRLKESVCQAFLSAVKEPASIIWEAPRKAQQVKFINRFGPDVNLGNIPPGETLTLEAMRRGLRGDTIGLIKGETGACEKPSQESIPV
ncbi:MAG: phosphosulfolactate synthase [Firmicutes bacterium]|nr:phosphosulfolactate synthase [Bacillota bacterium]